MAVFQQEHTAVGERVRNQAPAGFCPGLWDGEAPFYPPVFSKGEKVIVEIRAPGWITGEMLGVARNR